MPRLEHDVRVDEISTPHSDDLFGTDNPLDRLRKFIRLRLPVYFEHSDDPADAYRDHVIVMANEQNFVYTTQGGMAYVPWTMPATQHHGGVKMDDWRFVQRNGDWILQQHMSEPPLREESDDLFGPQRRTLTAREMSARMNLVAKQVGLDKILYRSGIADLGSGFEYHRIVKMNPHGFYWENRNGTPILATWEGAHEGGGRRWQYYREPTGEYIFHLPVYDDDLDESQDDALFEPTGKLKVISFDIPQETVYVRSALGLLGVKITKWDVIDNRYFIVDDHEVRTVNTRDITGQFDRNWNTAEFDVEVAEKLNKHTDDWLNEVMPDDVRQAMAEKHFLEESDDLFEPSSRALRVVNWDIPNHTVYVRSALGKLGIQITNWQQFNDEFDNLDSYQIVSVNGRSVTDDQQRAALDKAFKYQVAEQHQDYVETWLSYSIPHEVQTAMQAQQSAVEESDDQELFAPPGRLPKIRQAIKDTIKYYGAQLEYFEHAPEAQKEVSTKTMDTLHEYIGQAQHVLHQFIQGGIAALDHALTEVDPEVVDSIDADMHALGVSLDDIIRQHRRSLTEEDDDLFGKMPMWLKVDRFVKAGQPVLFQWAQGVFYPVTQSNRYSFYWTNSNGLDISTPWGTYTDEDRNWNLEPNDAGVMVLTDPDFLEESDDLFSDVNVMSRLQRFHEQGSEIKIADQNGDVWTTVGFLRGQQTGQPLMKIQREYMSGYNRHTESLNMTENGLEGAEIVPGSDNQIFVYLRPFERTTIEEAPEEGDDMFGAPTQQARSLIKNISELQRIPVLIKQALAYPENNFQRYSMFREAVSLATSRKIKIPKELMLPALQYLGQDPHVVRYLLAANEPLIPELVPTLIKTLEDEYRRTTKSYRSEEIVKYLTQASGQRIPELEKLLLGVRTAQQKQYAMLDAIQYGRTLPAADAWVMNTLIPQWKNADATALYLAKVHPGQLFTALEPLIATKPRASFSYAYYNRRQRWPEVESVIMTKPDVAFDYAQAFFKPDRWVEGEPAIARGRVPWSMYSARFLGTNNNTVKGRTDRDRWQDQALAGQPLTPPPPHRAGAQINETDDIFGEPTKRSKEIGEKLPVITQMMLALRQQNYQRAVGLATAHKLEIPPEYVIPAMTALLQNPHHVGSALSYLTQSVHQRIPELEPLLLDYIQDQLVNEPSAENYTANRAIEYLSSVVQARIPGLEEIFSSLRTVRQKSSAKEALARYGLNNPAADQWIIRTLLPAWKSPEATAHYLSQVHRGQRIQALEPIVLKKADSALRYAAFNLKQRWPRAETIIGSNGEAAYYYALYFLKPNRWPEAEPAIARDRVAWSMYARDFLGLNNHTKAGRAQRDAWREQVLAGQPMTPPPQGPSAGLVARAQQQQDWAERENQNPNPINETNDDLFEPQRLPRTGAIKQLINNQQVRLLMTWDGTVYDVVNVEEVPENDDPYTSHLAGWYEFLVRDVHGLTTITVDPRTHELVRQDDSWLVKERDALVEDDDDLFEPRGVTVEKINRLLDQYDIIYLQYGTGDEVPVVEIQEAFVSEIPGDIELALTTEWGETIFRNYPRDVLSIDYESSPPRVIVGGDQLQEAEDDLFGEPTKMAYVSRLLAALAEFQTEYTMALSAEENRDIRRAMDFYEKGDFIAGNAYLFDLYEDNLEHLKQYLWDRNLMASQQSRLPGTLTLRESDDDLFEPQSLKQIVMALSRAIDETYAKIDNDPGVIGSYEDAQRELRTLSHMQRVVNTGQLKATLMFMSELEDNTQEEIEWQLHKHSKLDMDTLRQRYLDESDDDLFEPNQRLQIYRAVQVIADRFQELNTTNLESMQDLVERYRRVADEFRRGMDSGYRAIWHILSGKYHWQRDLLFKNLKDDHNIDIENQFLDWVEQGRQY